MEWIGDYFQWIFDQGWAGIVVMLILTGVVVVFVVLAAANVAVWSIVGIDMLLHGGRTRAQRLREDPGWVAKQAAKHAELERLRELKAQGYSVRQIHEELRRTG